MRYVATMLIAACGLLVSSSSFGQNTIYVNGGGFSSPYYGFYSDSGLTQPLDIYSGGSNSLLTSQTYTFVKVATSHPFYMSDAGYEQPSTSLISLAGNGSATSGIGGVGQSFTLSFNGFDPSVNSLTYYCTAHSSMVGTLQVVPEPSSAILITIGGFAAIAIHRRRSRPRGERVLTADPLVG